MCACRRASAGEGRERQRHVQAEQGSRSKNGRRERGAGRTDRMCAGTFIPLARCLHAIVYSSTHPTFLLLPPPTTMQKNTAAYLGSAGRRRRPHQVEGRVRAASPAWHQHRAANRGEISGAWVGGPGAEVACARCGHHPVLSPSTATGPPSRQACPVQLHSLTERSTAQRGAAQRSAHGRLWRALGLAQPEVAVALLHLQGQAVHLWRPGQAGNRNGGGLVGSARVVGMGKGTWGMCR